MVGVVYNLSRSVYVFCMIISCSVVVEMFKNGIFLFGCVFLNEHNGDVAL